MDTVQKHGVQDAVRYFGGKGLEEIAAAIDECDVGLIPNRRSVFTEINTPTRIFEYLARGKPVITGRAPGVQDYFGDDALFFF
jgi:glycosyltransferase involved in cell wall biosynthesis